MFHHEEGIFWHHCRITSTLIAVVKTQAKRSTISVLVASTCYTKQWRSETFYLERCTGIRFLLSDANLPKKIWPAATCHRNWLRNRGPSSKLKSQIPILKSKKTQIDYSTSLYFGAFSFAYIYYRDTAKGN